MKAIITTDICPLYTEALSGSELADEALYGMVVEILSESKGFWRVRTHYNYEGYMRPSGALDNDARLAHWQAAPKWAVWAPYLDVKAEPRVQSANIATLPRAGLLEKLDTDKIIGDGYIQVGLPDGKKGYARRPCIKPEATSWNKTGETKLRGELVGTAKLFLGAQYRWGGKTALGIDCSGLTSLTYLLHGIKIYRDADIRPGFEMKAIKFSEKKQGDLVFFKGHVAMYIGNNEFIHSTANAKSEGVVINSFDPASSAYRGDLMNIIKTAGSVF